MALKKAQYKPKGMNRDWSPSAFNPEFCFENMNLRLTSNDGNTALSWTSEKGTKKLSASIMADWWKDEGNENATDAIIGLPIGVAAIDHKLIVFTTLSGLPNTLGSIPDRIYSLSVGKDGGISGKVLFCGNIGFDPDYPLETLACYETSAVQKVYWTDGLNQPRLINVAASKDKVAKWNKEYDSKTAGTRYIYPKATCFDFVPALSGDSSISVKKDQNGSGLFAPGVIQYCFTYYNENGQQSNIAAVSPLFYLCHADRGAAADDSVSASFTLELSGVDSNFDKVRVYSMQRTSVDGDMVVKRVADLNTSDAKDGKLSYVDNGTEGSLEDATMLLYVGGNEITAYTMAEKDNTLFLGNIAQKGMYMGELQKFIDKARGEKALVKFELGKTVEFARPNGRFYADSFELKESSQEDITTFKGGEHYRFGFQLQKKTGEWAEPVWIGDYENTLYPFYSVNLAYLTCASAEIDGKEIASELKGKMDLSQYVRIRPVVHFPNIGERNVLCQGVLNPTVFNVRDRQTGSPFAQASWFFRPYIWPEGSGSGQGGETEERRLTDVEAQEYVSVAVKSFPQGNPPDCSWEYSALDSKNYYVLIGQVDFDAATGERNYGRDIFKNGVIPYDQNGVSSSSGTCPFVGAIKLYGDNQYAFIGSSFKKPSEVSYFGFKEGSVHVSDDAYPLYVAMKTTGYDEETNQGRRLLYYQAEPQANAPESFVFKFICDSMYYEVAFDDVASTESVEEISASSADLGGVGLRFKHYDSLFCSDDLPKKKNDVGGSKVLGLAKRIEIQGSIKTYESPFVGNAKSAMHVHSDDGEQNSNTQFFIDQSIVTLNSPDLEFDTTAQRHSTDNMKLRIVGALPITAGASAHNITTSTSMLELNHNEKNLTEAKFGVGEINSNVRYKNISVNAYKRQVSEYLWEDAETYDYEKGADGDKIKTYGKARKFLVYPWQRNGSLNNDIRPSETASSWLKAKKESTMLYSAYTKFLSESVDLGKVGMQVPLTENGGVVNYRLQSQAEGLSEINYYANADKALVNDIGYGTISTNSSFDEINSHKVSSPVSMRYRSTTHAVLSLNADEDKNVRILPCARIGDEVTGKYVKEADSTSETFWGDKLDFAQSEIDLTPNSETDIFGDGKFGFLWLGEIYKDSVPFGEPKDTKWQVGGQSVEFATNGTMRLKWDIGDTYFQRYDCLKTYPMNDLDANQNTEILSFMCETRVNIDGRYDRNRGQLDNTSMSPQNFNLLNPVYSQRDNFFTYSKTDLKSEEELRYVNEITYSKTKTMGADIDLYANVTLASAIDMDGSKGSVNALRRLNDQIIAFQDTGLSQIMYNENVQVSSQDGVPIELANSGKVQGKRYFSDTVGCSDKWSIASTPNGLYFIDSVGKAIWLFNGQLKELSASGMNSWCKANLPGSSLVWTPRSFENYAAYYDRLNQDVLFIGKDTALAYSEKTGSFTSFYSYGGTQYLAEIDGKEIWLRLNGAQCGLWGHNEGENMMFFGEAQPYWMTLVCNQEPAVDKIFTNMEFRATVEGGGTQSGKRFNPYLPFDSIEAWDEYQRGFGRLLARNGSLAWRHGDDDAQMRRKFRTWRCDVPRDNAAVDKSVEAKLGISRSRPRPLDRIRNPWAYIRLRKNAESAMRKAEIHDIMAIYFA